MKRYIRLARRRKGALCFFSPQVMHAPLRCIGLLMTQTANWIGDNSARRLCNLFDYASGGPGRDRGHDLLRTTRGHSSRDAAPASRIPEREDRLLAAWYRFLSL